MQVTIFLYSPSFLRPWTHCCKLLMRGETVMTAISLWGQRSFTLINGNTAKMWLPSNNVGQCGVPMLVSVEQLYSPNASFSLDLLADARRHAGHSSKIDFYLRRLENMVVNLCLPHFYTAVHCNKVWHISWTYHVTAPSSSYRVLLI